MTNDIRHADVPVLIRQADAIAAEVKQIFGALTPSQVNWKPNDTEWSIGQCFDHVIIATTAYFPTLRQIIAGTKKPSFYERLPWLPSIFGPLLIRALSPDAARKARAPKVFHPTHSSVDGQIIGRFLHHQQELRSLMQASNNVDVARTIVTSPASTMITYSLIDAYRIIIVHEQLHLAQAQQLLRSPGFPEA